MENPCRWWTATGNARGGALVLLLSCASLLLILVPGARAAPWTPADLPSPQHDPLGMCGHDGRRSAVCDPDGLLPDDAVKIVDGVVNFIAEGSHGFAKMSCAGHPAGYQVAVAVLQKMAKDWRGLDARAKMFATKLHDAWGVGDAECNNGVLLLVAVEDRRMYISTGKGVKAVLTDARVQQVLGNMKAALRAGRLDLAIEAGVNDIGKTLAGQKIATADHSGSGFGVFVIAAVVAIAMLIPCFRRRSQYQKCRTALQRLESDRAMARQSQYAAVTCPICLEDFARTSPPPSPTRSGGAGISMPSSAKTYEALSSSDEISSSMRRTNSGSSSYSVSQRSKGSAETEGASSRCNPPSKAPARVLATCEPNPTASVLAASGPVGAAGSSSRCDQTITVGGSAKTSADELTPETTQVLQCGHKFHAACLRSMLQASHDSCPICRKPLFGRGESAGRSVDDDTSEVAGSPDDLPSGIDRDVRGEQERGAYLDWAAFYPEYVFRLGRARYLYPRFVTVDMVDRWSREEYDRPLATDGAFRALDPMLVSDARASGSGGSSFSFGGGGSSGGGGGGSSW
jgi:uncharacterized membrane protein YgcG